MFRIRPLMAGWLLAACLAAPTAAQDPLAEGEAAAVRAAAEVYVKARARGDREALLAAWTAEGDYIDAEGRRYHARDLIAREFADTAVSVREAGDVAIGSIRLITPEVAILDGTSTHAALRGETPPVSHFTAVWVKSDGRWLLDSLRESTVLGPPRNTRLDELRWILGDFAGQLDDGSDAVVSTSLTPDNNFILREVVVRHPDDSRRTVSQRIGWDPLSNAFKSWSFDSDGGYGEGSWKRQANCWIVVNSGVTADGRRTSGMSIYTDITQEGFVLEFVGTMVDGAPHPDVKAKFDRQTQPE